MESLENNCILNFNRNTLSDVRKQFNLGDGKWVNQSIDILEVWLQKQDYLVRKTYPRTFLERLIIFNKGSVEKVKSKIENICILRSVIPNFFDVTNISGREKIVDVVDGVLPQMTANHERVYILKNTAKRYENGLFHYFRYVLCIAEYIQVHDYNNGCIVVLDYRETDIYELIKAINVTELKQMFKIIIDGYCMRIKQIHVLSANKAVYGVTNILKQVLSAKLGDRITVHKTVDTLYDHIPKNILPEEYGGDEVSMDTIFARNYKEITSDPFLQYLEEMTRAVVTEKHRYEDKFRSDSMGVAGTFRSINID